jgi:hypothetical protein
MGPRLRVLMTGYESEYLELKETSKVYMLYEPGYVIPYAGTLTEGKSCV